MKFHEGFCQNQPCFKEHRYKCNVCSTLFNASQDTQYTPPGAVTLPTQYYPACSSSCYLTYDHDPNSLIPYSDQPL